MPFFWEDPSHRFHLVIELNSWLHIEHRICFSSHEDKLDIVENGKFGKSPTWFRCANLLFLMALREGGRSELLTPAHTWRSTFAQERVWMAQSRSLCSHESTVLQWWWTLPGQRRCFGVYCQSKLPTNEPLPASRRFHHGKLCPQYGGIHRRAHSKLFAS